MRKSFVPKYFKRILTTLIILTFMGAAFGLNERFDIAKKEIMGDIYSNEIIIDERLIDLLVYLESSNNPRAHKKKTGARGLMQITPLAWKDLSRHFPAQYKSLSYRKHVFIPYINKRAGCDYLIILKNYLKIKGIPVTLDNLVAAYNWGIGNLTRYGLTKAPRETRRLIARVRASY